MRLVMHGLSLKPKSQTKFGWRLRVSFMHGLLPEATQSTTVHIKFVTACEKPSIISRSTNHCQACFNFSRLAPGPRHCVQTYFSLPLPPPTGNEEKYSWLARLAYNELLPLRAKSATRMDMVTREWRHAIHYVMCTLNSSPPQAFTCFTIYQPSWNIWMLSFKMYGMWSVQASIHTHTMQSH